MSLKAKAIIMAGGRSERMRRTSDPRHKALVPVLGVSMLERNLFMLLSSGFSDIVVATNSRETAIRDFVETRGRELCGARGAKVRCFEEEEPLGTIGAASFFNREPGPLLVVNVDNLTALDLEKFVSHHVQSESSLSIATHQESFRIPFGEVILKEGWVEEYREKPAIDRTISSGTYVLSGKACAMIRKGRKTDLPELFSLLISKGEKVSSFPHEAPWIDVNDPEAVERAEGLIASRHEDFEWWKGGPDAHVVSLLVSSPEGVLVRFHGDKASRYRRMLDLPGREFRPEEAGPEEALRSWPVWDEYLSGVPVTFSGSFDNLDTTTRKIIRHHLFMVRISESSRGWDEQSGFQWVPADKADIPAAGTVSRALAYQRRSPT